MMAKIWNPVTREYAPYQLPDGASVYESDMGAVVSCAVCGREIAFGECYTSLQVHDGVGFGYAVCPQCHDAELACEAGAR